MDTNTNLSIRKAASDLAFQTVNDSSIAVDKTCADTGVSLQLTDTQYQQFKRDVTTFRQSYSQAKQLDTQAAQQAAAAAKRAAAAVKPATPAQIQAAATAAAQAPAAEAQPTQ